MILISQWSSGATRTSFEGEKSKSGASRVIQYRNVVPCRLCGWSTCGAVHFSRWVLLYGTVLVYTRTPENRYRSRRHRFVLLDHTLVLSFFFFSVFFAATLSRRIAGVHNMPFFHFFAPTQELRRDNHIRVLEKFHFTSRLLQGGVESKSNT